MDLVCDRFGDFLNDSWSLQILLIYMSAHFGLSSGGGQSWQDALRISPSPLVQNLLGRFAVCDQLRPFHGGASKSSEDHYNEALRCLEVGFHADDSAPHISTLHGFRFCHLDGTQLRTGAKSYWRNLEHKL